MDKLCVEYQGQTESDEILDRQMHELLVHILLRSAEEFLHAGS